MSVSEEIRSLIDEMETRHKQEMEEKFELQRIEMEKRMNCLLPQQLQSGTSDSIKEDFDESPELETRKNGLKRLKSTLARIFGVDKYSAISDINTETLSLFVVASVVNKDEKFIRKLVLSCLSLIFMWLQFFALFLIVTESSWPDCYSMVDCPDGTYCGINRFAHPSCKDCSAIFKELGIKKSSINDDCLAIYGEKKWSEMGLAGIDHNMLHVQSTSDDASLKCLSFKHCNSTDIDASPSLQYFGSCDFLALTMSKLDGRSWVLILFLSCLWALPVSKDIEEASIEEMILDHHLAGALIVPAELVRLTLRVRRCIIPFLAVSATIVLLVTDHISAKNIILNFLAITFIQEADNIAAELFLRYEHRKLMDSAVRDLENDTLSGRNTIYFWTRLQGIACFLVLVVGIATVNSFVKNCSDLSAFLEDMARISTILLLTFEAFYMALKKRDGVTTGMKLFRALNEFFRVMSTFAVARWLFFAVSYLLDGDDTMNKFSKKVSEYLTDSVSVLMFIVLETIRWKIYWSKDDLL